MIKIYSEKQIDKIREACQITAKILQELKEEAVSGVTTFDLDWLAKDLLKEFGANSGCLGYNENVAYPYPAVICTSVNNEVIHGLPSDRVFLQMGDLLTIDLAIEKDGYYGDSAISFLVGGAGYTERRLLIEITELALQKGIEQAITGNRLGDVSAAIQKYIEDRSYGVVKQGFGGHGIGDTIHQDPHILNYGKAGTGPILKKGMVLAIEPMVTIGKPRVITLSDQWTIATKDRSLAAHCEHTITVRKDKAEILTKLK